MTVLGCRDRAASVVVMLGRNLKELEGWAQDLQTLWPTLTDGAPAPAIHILPDTADLEEDDPRAFELECDRLAALTALSEIKAESRKLKAEKTNQTSSFISRLSSFILLATPKSLLLAAPSPESLSKSEIRLAVGEEVRFNELQDRLGHELGYDCEAVCETPGQYAVRGGLLDVYPLNAAAPVRIDFFGDEIESVREFDPTTQRSGQSLETVVIASAHSQRRSASTATALDYLPDTVQWVLPEPKRLEDDFHGIFYVPENIAAPSATFAKVVEKRSAKNDSWLALSALDEASAFLGQRTPRAVETESLEAYRTFAEEDKLGIVRQESERASRSRFLKRLQGWQREGYRVTVCLRNAGERTRLDEIFHEEAEGFTPHFTEGALADGFRVNVEGLKAVWVTGDEIVGRHRVRVGQRRRKLPEHAAIDQALDFSELADGDHLVHLQNGICIFRGLQTMDLGGRKEEVISLEFAEGVTVHVRLHESHLLSRYVGLSKVSPKLGKIGGNTWEKTRAAAERATLDFAAELLRMQAERDVSPGHAFGPDQQWLKNFEDAFPFQETPDQLRAINDAKHDMEQPHPMDRLICGDVGFGKTEVALRAAFKCVLDGKQAAILIPTTVLCQQHYMTFKERLAEYPVVVEMLSRFRNAREQKEIKRQLKAGEIDIIVGTHSLLGRGVEFADLGLLVIDEEHRFGVRQKEAIKRLRQNVDVLTMSATPIPRTLHSALVGVRQMSVIETAPRDRLPIETIVKAYDPALIKDAIRFEINRGGQVFYLHNRVQTIESVAARLRELLPDIRLAVGHGQMAENDLEKIMTDFVDGRYDLLLCTTIIESGLDIPNCNTIIIEGADRFGLSQLYQLRGRVGRFKKQAYAYLLLHRHARLLDLARKRLGAIRQYNQLGAGFRIAMRDLELRGAGNLLGPQQSGHIAGVGFDLYCQLLRQSVSRLKGDPQAATIRANVRLDFVVLGEKGSGESGDSASVDHGYEALKQAERQATGTKRIEAALPHAYIHEPRLRIDFYRRLALADNLEAVNEIGEALRDRFGKHPQPVQALLLLTEIRVLAERHGISAVETEGDKLKLRIASQKNQFVQHGGRFPRLNSRKPLGRLKEIAQAVERM